MKKYKIGYTQGVFDLFHIGHLNILKKAKKQCDYLIVGINSDKLVKNYKNKTPVINDTDRKKIVESIKYVDKCIIVNTLDKEKIYTKLKFNAIFIGSDWKGNARWCETKKQMRKNGVEVVFLKHTDGISTTNIRKRIAINDKHN